MNKRQILFIQGAGAGTHDAWDKQLVKSLSAELGNDFGILYPRMPDEGEPNYFAWKAAILSELAKLDDGAMVIGHSLGGTILLNALAEEPSPQKLRGIFIVAAPFIGPGGWPSDEINSMADIGSRLIDDTPIHLYHGTLDDIAPISHLDHYRDAIPNAIVHKLNGRNHQLNNNLAELAKDIPGLVKA